MRKPPSRQRQSKGLPPRWMSIVIFKSLAREHRWELYRQIVDQYQLYLEIDGPVKASKYITTLVRKTLKSITPHQWRLIIIKTAWQIIKLFTGS